MRRNDDDNHHREENYYFAYYYWRFRSETKQNSFRKAANKKKSEQKVSMSSRVSRWGGNENGNYEKKDSEYGM